MYIVCPECDTKFVVTAEQIGDGKKVRCSKCSHVWHQTLDKNVRIEPIVAAPEVVRTELGKGVNLPALLPVRVSPFLYGLPFLLIGMIIFMMVTLFPSIFQDYSFLNNKELNIYDLQIVKNKDLGKIIVAYKVINSSKHNVNIPLVRIRLFDKNNKLIEFKIDDYSKVELVPSQDATITSEFMLGPVEAENIDVMLGNELDFMLR
jgi:predicted Zn finger-like uncharacterized protein